MSISHKEELRLLSVLCRELVGLGLHVGMSDAKPALSVRLGRLEPWFWISVSATGEFFEWCRDTHTAADPAGAAHRIADRIRSWGRWPFGGT
jgi:hypothetical protein